MQTHNPSQATNAPQPLPASREDGQKVQALRAKLAEAKRYIDALKDKLARLQAQLEHAEERANTAELMAEMATQRATEATQRAAEATKKAEAMAAKVAAKAHAPTPQTKPAAPDGLKLQARKRAATRQKRRAEIQAMIDKGVPPSVRPLVKKWHAGNDTVMAIINEFVEAKQLGRNPDGTVYIVGQQRPQLRAVT